MSTRAVRIFFAITSLWLVLVGPARDLHAQMRSFDCTAKQSLGEAEGKRLLDLVQKTYSKIEVLKGDFSQESYVAALDEGEVSSGEIWFGKPGKMRWVYSQPRDQTVVINNGTLWLFQPDKNQVLIDDVSQVLLSNLPIVFMSGVGSLSRDFDFKGACRNSDGVVLDLAPHRSDSSDGADPLEGFKLLVDEHRNLPKGAKITSLGGNVTAIVFNNLRTDGVKAEGGTFVLEYPKGVDLVDRRLKQQ